MYQQKVHLDPIPVSLHRQHSSPEKKLGGGATTIRTRVFSVLEFLLHLPKERSASNQKDTMSGLSVWLCLGSNCDIKYRLVRIFKPTKIKSLRDETVLVEMDKWNRYGQQNRRQRLGRGKQPTGCPESVFYGLYDFDCQRNSTHGSLVNENSVQGRVHFCSFVFAF